MKNTMLMLATTAAMSEQFNKNNILILEEMGYEVHVAGNFLEGNPVSQERLESFKKWLKQHHAYWHHIPATRSPFDFKNNGAAYKQVVELIKEHGISFIHCHTPIGSVIGRVAAHTTKTKVIYTAHGFHFFKGAPLLNWMLYYPVERFLSRWTDVLVLINQEDYARAKESFRAKRVAYIPGVGIDVPAFKEYIHKQNGKGSKREFLFPEGQIAEDDFVVISVGEVNKNKNHEVIIRAIKELNDSRVKYLICGIGDSATRLQSLIKEFALEKQVFLLGYKSNILDYLYISDVFAFPSKREGLGLAALEAMAMGVPLLTSNIHGINDYSKEGVTGYTASPTDVTAFKEKLEALFLNPERRIMFGEYNKQEVEKYSLEKTTERMTEIYKAIEI